MRFTFRSRHQHRHVNTGDDEAEKYVACENAPLLQNLDIALREEAPIND